MCQSVISIDSIFRTGKNYLQMFLEECKYVIKEKKIHNYIDDVEIFSDSDEENYNEDNSDEEFLGKISEEDSSEENSDEKK